LHLSSFTADFNSWTSESLIVMPDEKRLWYSNNP